ncbi:MAG: hypothetical protein ACM33B_05920 [Pseudomonadota bacterium]
MPPGLLERLVYRLCFAVACLSGRGAARCVRAVRALGAHGSTYGPVVVVAQLPLLLLWAAARAVFLVTAAPCFAIANARRP